MKPFCLWIIAALFAFGPHCSQAAEDESELGHKQRTPAWFPLYSVPMLLGLEGHKNEPDGNSVRALLGLRVEGTLWGSHAYQKSQGLGAGPYFGASTDFSKGELEGGFSLYPSGGFGNLYADAGVFRRVWESSEGGESGVALHIGLGYPTKPSHTGHLAYTIGVELSGVAGLGSGGAQDRELSLALSIPILFLPGIFGGALY